MIKKIINFNTNILNLDQTTYYINGSENLLPPLTKEEEDFHVEQYEKGSIESRNILIEHNLRLVVYVAKKYDTDINNLEDLISIGTIGLIKAINTFRLDKNIKLATYASRCIENEILMHLRKKAKSRLEISLDEPLKVDYDGNELLLEDILFENDKTIYEEIDKEEINEQLIEALKCLKPREREILEMRFGLNNQQELTQKEASDKLNISQSYISRLEKKILKKLKQTMKNHE